MVRIINIDTKARTIRVSNGKDDLDWFTTDTGSHVPLKKGQSKAEAIKEHFGDGRSSGKKRLDELNKKYGTNKGYLIQSDRPLDKKKDGVIKEYEDFGKATPEVSLTETGSGFHERTKQPAKQKSKPTSYQLEEAFEEADLGEEWKSAQRRMDFHGVSQYTIKDIIDSGMYEAGDIIEALESNRHDKIDEMKKMADRTVGEKNVKHSGKNSLGR